MKKITTILIGLFLFTACSNETNYYDKLPQNEDNTGGNTTFSFDPDIGYESPFNIVGATGLNYHKPVIFDMNMPVDHIEITPYLGSMYGAYHEDWVNNGMFPHFIAYGADVTALPTDTPLYIKNGYTVYQDCYGQFSTNPNLLIPTPTFTPCATMPFIFDYGYPTYPNLSPGETTVLGEMCKIYFIKYEIVINGQYFEGFLRHQLGNDSLTSDDLTGVTGISNAWTYFSDFPIVYNGTISGANFDKMQVLRNNKTDELVLIQEAGYTTLMPSEEVIVDPTSGIAYTIRFRHEIDKIIIEMMP